MKNDGKKYITIPQVAEYVKKDVRQATNGNQNPQVFERGLRSRFALGGSALSLSK